MFECSQSPFLYPKVWKADQVLSLFLGALLQDAVQRKTKIDILKARSTLKN